MWDQAIRRSVIGSLVIGALAVTVWSAVAQAGPAPTPTPTPTVGVPSYSIANAPSDVQTGAEFTVDLILDLGDYSSDGHQVSVSFTPGLLMANAAVELGVPPYQFNTDPGVQGIDNAAGVVDGFEAAAYRGIHPETPFVVGQITFQAGDVGGATIIGFFGDDQAVLDGGGRPIDGVVFNSVSVNVIATPTPWEKVTVCHKGKNLISLPPNAVPRHLAHGDTLGAARCLECEFPVSGTFCACNDSWPICLAMPPVCPLGTVLAVQYSCWACVDSLTCRPVEQ